MASRVASSESGSHASQRSAPDTASRQRESAIARSEEHTSELQSQSNLVCRLLLEKKKQSFSPSPLASYFSSTSLITYFSTCTSTAIYLLALRGSPLASSIHNQHERLLASS